MNIPKIDDMHQIADFLDQLDYNKNYILSIQFFTNVAFFDQNVPQMSLSLPILVNRFSSSTTISIHIIDKIEEMIDIFYLEYSIVNSPSILALTYTEIFIE